MTMQIAFDRLAIEAVAVLDCDPMGARPEKRHVAADHIYNPHSPDETAILTALIRIPYTIQYLIVDRTGQPRGTGEAGSEALRLEFDRRLMLQFRASMIIASWMTLSA